MSLKTQQRRRIVIDDSSSDESGSSTASPFFLSPDKENTKDHTNIDGIDRLTGSLNRIQISQSNNKRSCMRGGVDSLNFFSDSSSDDDSLIEVLDTLNEPSNTPQTRASHTTPDKKSQSLLELLESSDSSIEVLEDNDNNTCEDSADGRQDPNELWSLDERCNEFYLSSISKIKVPKFRIPAKLFNKLYDFQRSGVAWMASLHCPGSGGVLGDDMGMGKTFMTLALVGGLMRAKTIRNCLIVAPKSVLRSWEAEAKDVLKMCVPNVNVEVLSSEINKATRRKRLKTALQCSSSFPQLIITTYGLIGSSPEDFTHHRSVWDYVILDEAHTIKNPSTRTSQGCRKVAYSGSTRRLLLTGTPIMNNLKELWALFDFATSGRLLGSLSTFKNRFGTPIEDARSSDATDHTIKIGEKANDELQEKLRPYFLQRMKIDFLAHLLPKKTDFVVWTHLSTQQRELYSKYVESKDSTVADILSGIKTSPLEAVTWLKKLCGHPILVEANGTLDPDFLSRVSVSELKRHSSKLEVLDALVGRLRSQNSRILIFSQSTKMLDIIERVLKRRSVSRIDGTTKERERQRNVDAFNHPNSKIEVMLLSTKAAGVGLTLTGADRAIVYDPSWNPAEDAQAIDRCYRIGQKKAVTVFRLITAGSVEEKMYEKQIHKDGIRRAVMTSMGSETTRYFEKGELRKLFQLGAEGECEFLDRLKRNGLNVHENSREAQLTVHSGVVGISSHDSVYAEGALQGRAGGTTDENPFSSPSAPSKTPILDSGAHEKPKRVGKSQRVLFGNPELSPVPVNEKKIFPMIRDKKKTPGPEDAVEAKNTIASTENRKPRTFFEVLGKCDTLRSSGNAIGALELMMDALNGDYVELDKNEKITVHQNISSIAYELRWL